MGLSIFQSESVLSWLEKAVLIFALVILTVQLLSITGSGKGAIAVLLCLGVGLSLYYLQKTPPWIRTYDVFEGGGHYDYIRHVADNLSLPQPNDGWEYHQPPLYYVIAAAFDRIGGFVGVEDRTRLQQYVSVGFYAGFLFFALQTIWLLFNRGKLPVTLGLLLITWPAAIIHSVRIGNDALFYLLAAATIFYLIRWQQSLQFKHYVLACGASALALITKSNALALIAAVGLIVILMPWMTGIKTRGRYLIVLFGITILSVLINLADNIFLYFDGKSRDWLMANSSMPNSGLYVGNSLSVYLGLDLSSFINHPFTSTWNPQLGRQNFWNFLLKSSLFGEFSFAGLKIDDIAIAMSMVLLILIVLALIGAVWQLRKNAWQALGVVLPFIFLFTLLLAFRLRYPMSCNGDFRYIFPGILSFLVCLGWADEAARARGLRLGGYVVSAVLVATISLNACFLFLTK